MSKLHLLPAQFYWVDDRTKKQKIKDRTTTRGRDLVMPRQRWEKTRHSRKPTTFPRWPRLPREVQLRVWMGLFDQPGIHFLAAALKRDSPLRPFDPADPYAYKQPFRKTIRVARVSEEDDGREVVDSTEVDWWEGEDWDPSRRGRLCLVEPFARTTRLGSFVTYAEGFPAGRRSLFASFEGAVALSGLPARELRALHDEPLDVRLGDGRLATIDAARDLVYVKFLSGVHRSHDPPNRCHTYARAPEADLLVHRRTNDESFNGIRRVAVEVDPLHLTTCMIPTLTTDAEALFTRNTCDMCRRYKRAHGRYDEGMRNAARFLHAFPDLREVFLVFPWHPRMAPPVVSGGTPGGGGLYRARGRPPRTVREFAESGLRARRTTLVGNAAAGREFWCGGSGGSGGSCGSRLAEPTGWKDGHAALVDVYQWWFNEVWELPGTRPEDWRGLRKKVEAVEFRILVWVYEEDVR